ncbi:periplasmic binding protein/LacI transcriptional regulator [Denitrovibrio acetiphilus DSM 12809]|uniref:Periplasmic binding protein/LacI transcriptional regulator n=1 Tax=Denitrovibrio acetiphilus (strain DSM 12809 / NBRC 114555 / N2460) TaxID=522772 RepID=D4H281_DENA2|nr:sugar ABC transporter substrate-binding protein [Denitrovibrio acetiphilus]ADD68872.1 periplasmic binding protein/LacI transcriptional regulator [Denitrovibrio acetiphilus DSM 12809]
MRKIILIIAALALLTTSTVMAAGLKDAPAPFNGTKKIHIALIRQMVEGEFMQMYRAGAQRQADLMGIKLTVFGKNMDNQAQANFIYQAINMGVDGIIIDHGLTETMVKPAKDALAKGIPVVAFDVDLKNPEIPQIAQDDHMLGRLSLEAMIKDFDGKANVGYVYVPGILPLDKRDESFTKIKKEYPGIKELARTGTLESPFSVKNADQVKAILRSKPEINAYFAPYDELAKGVILALQESNMTKKIRVYSADISTQDIQLMVREGSPWAATAATNPAAIGAVSVRAICKKIAGEQLPADILIPPMLFTQEMIREAGVKNMKQLRAKFPQFNHVERAMAPWIPVDKKGLF